MSTTSSAPPRPSRVGGLPVRAWGRIGQWWLEAGVQVRSTVAAAAVQALVVAAAGAVLLLALNNNLRVSLDTTNVATAQSIAPLVTADIATNIATDIATAPVEARAGDATGHAALQEAIDAASRRRASVQVLNTDGVVVAASSDLTGATAFLDEHPAAGETEMRQIRLPFDDDPYRATALGVDVGGRTATVLVAESLGVGEDTLHTAVVALAVAGPLLLLTVGGATYLFIGRSLRPVSEIRATVERISHRDLSERVPIPPGHDEVAELARTMNTMLAGLERADTAQRQFVSDASHELRSPIATLRAAADISLAVPDRGERTDLAVLVRGESQRLDQLVADLLLLARLDEGARPDRAVEKTLQEVDLDDLVTAEARRLRTSTTLSIGVRRDPARVLGDPLHLSRVVRNLADNAARHADTSVSITLRQNGSTVVLTVTNDGPPISGADRERVFERFVRLEESRARDSGGSGLGLAIVRDVVTAHGGAVTVTDPEDGAVGTTFRVELPLPAQD